MVKLKEFNRTPVFLTLGVWLFVCAVWALSRRLPDRWDFLGQLELKTYDWRTRVAAKVPAPTATNLAFLAMEDSSIAAVKYDRFLHYFYGLYWPRDIYAHLTDELKAEGAKLVAYDVLFGELRSDQSQVPLPDGSFIEPDVFFAQRARAAGNVLIAADPKVIPPPIFSTNVLGLGDVSTEKDADGILRRVKAFSNIRHWHKLFLMAAQDPDYGFTVADLGLAKIEGGKIEIPQSGTTNFVAIPVDAENNFELSDFLGDSLPRGMPPKAKAFTDERLWQMGILMAAEEMHLDLGKAEIDLPHGRIRLSGPNGLQRVIPVDSEGYFYVNWRLAPGDRRLTQAAVETVLAEDKQRNLGTTNVLSDRFRDKLVVVGSAATGNDLTDRGATPLERDTLLPCTYWNVANSIIMGQFIQPASAVTEFAAIGGLGLLAAWITWQLRRRIVYASLSVAALVAAYIGAAFYLFVADHWWLPIFFPAAGAMLLHHGAMVVYIVIVEGREKRHIRNIFSKMLSPDVVNELLGAEHFSMVGNRREVSVLFADIRGFTTLTDEMQDSATEFIHKNQLQGDAAEKCHDESARETLQTVNSYLTKVADAVIGHRGTLDKYIGDCVMAFWGAPLGNEQHAADCVRAAVVAQRAINQLNQERMAENAAREAENKDRIAAGLPPRAPLRALQLGTGINTGTVIVGLMGSGEQNNYTIFGREVNLASRLEGVSGSGRIIISEVTFRHLQRHDPALASTCVELPSVTVKGIRTAVRIFEVPWKQEEKMRGE